MDNFLKYNDQRIPVDKEGYLKNLDQWDEQVAEALADSCQIRLREAHWEIIYAVRKFYQEHELSPPMRPLVKLVKRELGEDKGRSIYLMKLFGGSAAKTVNKIAGLPRPANCI
ncbi:MAG: TusE/DsrC/DsvC family sulfur relay protein [Gammaproteobacteria bacterium]|nr:TusE/DsrC/DsvC family sulfur relay protein [Gammaproteobacteria bacterium]